MKAVPLLITLILFICAFSYWRSSQTTGNSSPNTESAHSKSGYAGIRGDRWDILRVVADGDSSEAAGAFARRIVQTDSKACFSWVLKEPPEALALLAIIAQDDDIDPSDGAYEFWKFMHEPGFEVLLTEAAYKGYAPAMSILASFCENNGRASEAEYWRKVGTAHANPTALLLRGMEEMIQGKLTSNDCLLSKGHRLIILASMLGEERASDMPELNAPGPNESISKLSQNELLDIICEIEGDDTTRVMQLVRELENGLSGEQVQVSHLISLIQKINDLLDKPDVTVVEIRYLFSLRQTLSTEILAALEDNDDARESFEKAEFMWRNQQIPGGVAVLETVLTPLIFKG